MKLMFLFVLSKETELVLSMTWYVHVIERKRVCGFHIHYIAYLVCSPRHPGVSTETKDGGSAHTTAAVAPAVHNVR